MDRSDNRDREGTDRCEPRLEDRTLSQQVLLRESVALLEVCTHAERATAAAGQDDGAHVGIGADRLAHLAELDHELGGQRVEGMGPMQHDLGDVAVTFAQDEW